VIGSSLHHDAPALDGLGTIIGRLHRALGTVGEAELGQLIVYADADPQPSRGGLCVALQLIGVWLTFGEGGSKALEFAASLSLAAASR
jgi:hypothetical protein